VRWSAADRAHSAVRSDDLRAGLQTSQPASGSSQAAWKPEYAHLAQRLKLIGIPPGGQEKFHIHALLHIYINGLLAHCRRHRPRPAKGIESSMHTHDGSGIIHMEAPHPFKYTLGDFFSVWGVKLGPAQVGGLKGYGGDHLHFYLNGRPLSNPAALVLHKDDSVVIGYGRGRLSPQPEQVPAPRGRQRRRRLAAVDKNGQKAKSCLAPKASSARAKSSTS